MYLCLLSSTKFMSTYTMYNTSSSKPLSRTLSDGNILLYIYKGLQQTSLYKMFNDNGSLLFIYTSKMKEIL
jgi:hypothetical protein